MKKFLLGVVAGVLTVGLLGFVAAVVLVKLGNPEKSVEKNSTLKTQKPAHQGWMNLSIGRAGFNLAAITSLWNTATNSYGAPEVRVELYLTGPSAKSNFATLEERRVDVEKKCGAQLTWHNRAESKSCKVYVRRDGDFTQRGQWPEQFAWLLKNLELFRSVFGSMVHEL